MNVIAMMTYSQMIEALRSAGYAVVAIEPSEIPEDIDVGWIEQRMEDRAYDIITRPETDDGPLDCSDEPIDFPDDVQADADVLKSAGWGTDEDYNGWNEEGPL